MSHYLYLNEPVDKRHLLFMQNNFDEVFTAIEKRELTVNIYRKTRPENQEELLIMSKDEPVIKLDVDILAASLEHNKKMMSSKHSKTNINNSHCYQRQSSLFLIRDSQ
ncbi:hypothetical protein BZ17_2398 [Yersinia pseudotuberculosis IP 32953]|nr:hypothetical protein BZ21_3542 [Yersinia pseudotuberculosis]AJJ57094.1 hypothetical protein BZ17_2398 [Yersinia pseudotuberculosis IP 32953]AJJ65402.1 hypothetical protein BZ16_3653 [Yersinia pseudotuberculosis PB1/+]PSH16903.1 hypothetical protein BLA52_14095 [Yersinia pseudotuberculosis]PSH25277.1 hypothetical protein BLA50_13285 [Yersinia pseudotuberculosis]